MNCCMVIGQHVGGRCRARDGVVLACRTPRTLNPLDRLAGGRQGGGGPDKGDRLGDRGRRPEVEPGHGVGQDLSPSPCRRAEGALPGLKSPTRERNGPQTYMANGRGSLIRGYDLARADETHSARTAINPPTGNPANGRAQTRATSHKTGSGSPSRSGIGTITPVRGSGWCGLTTRAMGRAATVTRGRENKASGPYASVSGRRESPHVGSYTSVTR